MDWILFIVITTLSLGNASPSAPTTPSPTAMQSTVSPTSCQPSFLPTRNPRPLPTFSPSEFPSVNPTFSPTTDPSSQPTVEPTIFPTPTPSVKPTPSPSHVPSLIPSCEPSMGPSPTPTLIPVSPPSPVPSPEPTRSPTEIPTSQPSGAPSADPSSQPSRQPSSQPSADSPRNFQCGECEYSSDYTQENDCALTSPIITIHCPSEDANTTCSYDSYSFFVGNNVNITVEGGCMLNITVDSLFQMSENSTINAAAVSISSETGAPITISGTISTSGRGLQGGPGAPPKGTVGWGGSYGGSGGRPECNNTVFSNTPSQVGGMFVPIDFPLLGSSADPTSGSGGGDVYGAGRGGGFIVLNSTVGGAQVFISETGALLADGSSPLNDGLGAGAGSGGSISIIANSVSGSGLLAARGGSVELSSMAGAGGGGRVSIQCGSQPCFDDASQILVNGGEGANNRACTSGAAGSVYILSSVSIAQANMMDSSEFSLADAGDDVNGLHESLKSVDNYFFDVEGDLVAGVAPSGTLVLVGSSSAGYSYAGTFIDNLTSDTALIQGFAYAQLLLSTNMSFVDQFYLSESTLTLGRFNDSDSSKDTHVDDAQTIELVATNISLTGSHIFDASNAFAVSVSCTYMTIDPESSLLFTRNLTIITPSSADNSIVEVAGIIQQSNSSAVVRSIGALAYQYSGITISGRTLNLILGTVQAVNVIIAAKTVDIGAFASISPPVSGHDGACWTDLMPTDFMCSHSAAYTGSLRSNYTIILTATSKIVMQNNSRVQGAAVMLCADDVTIVQSAKVDADGRGCEFNRGLGSMDIPGAGANGCIYGQCDASADDDEASIPYVPTVVPVGSPCAGSTGLGGGGDGEMSGNTPGSSGSGGNCTQGQRGPCSSGGGIVHVHALSSLILSGNVSANGNNGCSPYNGCGGGSGGSVVVIAPSFSGSGKVFAVGGSGGLGGAGGGGGGGGFVNLSQPYTSFDFTGQLNVNGGSGPESATSLAGSAGVFWLPQCSRGYGNAYTRNSGELFLSVAICQECVTGSYQQNPSSAPCRQCSFDDTEVPSGNQANAQFIGCDITPAYNTPYSCPPVSKQCPYQCKIGYTTQICGSGIQVFLEYVGRWCCTGNPQPTCSIAGFVVDLIFLLFLIFAPLKIYRWIEFNFCRRFLPSELGTDKRNLHRSGNVLEVDAIENGQRQSMMELSSNISESLVSNASQTLKRGQDVDNASEDHWRTRESSRLWSFQHFFEMKSEARSFDELRRAFRLGEQGLSCHGCRVYLLGSNHPHARRGGPWRLSPARPICLRPMLLREEYQRFAEEVTAAVAWDSTLEMMLFYSCKFILPPWAARLMSKFRRDRAKKLMAVVASYDHSCFRSQFQRYECASIRLGISPDCCLAYIDFLYNDLRVEAAMKPLCPIGQPKLPVSFRFSGLGTYFSPWLLDTNDLLLQAVAQTTLASTFIDEKWIDFVANLNVTLRTVQYDSLQKGLYDLMSYLVEAQASVESASGEMVDPLGGLIVELCTFSNIPIAYPSDSYKAARCRSNSRASIASLRSSSGGTSELVNSRTSLASSWRHSDEGGWGQNFPRIFSNDTHPMPPPDQFRHSVEISAEGAGGDTSHSPLDNAVSAPSDNPRTHHMVRAKETGIWRLLCDCTGRWVTSRIPTYGAFPTENATSVDGLDQSLLSYEAMCDAVQRGVLTLGIRVTHKSLEASVSLEDDDYQSEDGHFEEEDSPNMQPRGRTNALHFGEIQSDHGLTVGQIERATTSANVESKQIDHGAYVTTYGVKAKEMEKFYEIARIAETNMAVGKAAASMSPSVIPSDGEAKAAASMSPSVIPSDGEAKAAASMSPSVIPSDGKAKAAASMSPSVIPSDGEAGSGSADSSLSSLNFQDSLMRIDISGKKLVTAGSEGMKNDSKDEFREFNLVATERQRHLSSKRSCSDLPVTVNPLFGSSSEQPQPAAAYVRRSRRELKDLNIASSAYQCADNPWRIIEQGEIISDAFLDDRKRQLIRHSTANDAKPVEVHSASFREAVREAYSFNSIFSRSLGEDVLSVEARASAAPTKSTSLSEKNFALHMRLIHSKQSWMQYFRYQLSLSYITRWCLGGNIRPAGSSLRRWIYGLILLGCSVLDFLVAITTTIFFLYINLNSSTSLANTYQILPALLPFLVWPGALILAPINGIVTVLYGPYSVRAKVYACWSRLALVSTAVTVVLFVIAYNQLYVQFRYWPLYSVITLVTSRLLQCIIVDYYVALIENMREAKGWYGLPTSLYDTQARLRDIE